MVRTWPGGATPLLFFGLDLAMSPYIDRPITEWEAVFLPMEVDGKLTKLEIGET